MSLWRKKPVVINAVQWFKHGDHYNVLQYGESTVDHMPMYGKCGFIETLEGIAHVIPGDWIITGIKGEVYNCKDDIFQQTYEKVNESESNETNH